MARLAAFVPASVRPLARKLRALVTGPETLDRVLTAAETRAEFVTAVPSLLLEKGLVIGTTIRVRNTGSAVLSPHGRHPIRLTTRWLTPRKVPLDFATTPIPLPHAFRPGETCDVPVPIRAPDSLGHFLFEVDLDQAGGTAFRDTGNKPLWIEFQVTGRNVDDIDYHKAYATADLTQDYWTVVGPGTKEEFDKLGKAKLDTLQELGLTPNARVLDVGCGTGQLAVPLESYLSDRGAFVGTDIGPEAIEFCKKHYLRPNFRFFHNEMTTVPLTGETFDFITFFSVFTHTFPDETALLLAEAKRLLAPGGVIIGDVFTSPVVERCSGNRGAMELNREHFLRLVGLVGLTPTVHASWPWQKFGTREVFTFRHPGAA